MSDAYGPSTGLRRVAVYELNRGFCVKCVWPPSKTFPQGREMDFAVVSVEEALGVVQGFYQGVYDPAPPVETAEKSEFSFNPPNVLPSPSEESEDENFGEEPGVGRG